MKSTIALIGNPNSGKSSLFNSLTGLRQKIGNFAGVTVDKKTGFCRLADNAEIEIIDLPGTYSIYPNSLDEQVVLDVLANPSNSDYPDVAVVVADASNLKRNLLLFEQVSDLGIPTILALNMLDVAEEKGMSINSGKLSKILGVPVVELNARQEIGIEGLKHIIFKQLQEKKTHTNTSFFDEKALKISAEVMRKFAVDNPYLALQYAAQVHKLSFLKDSQKKTLNDLVRQYDFDADRFQADETMKRYADVVQNLEGVIITNETPQKTISDKLDDVLVHRVGGYAIFLAILLLIFQSVFTLAQYPMDWIDENFANLNEWLKSVLPASQLTNLLTDGLMAGIGGVVIFIPQIAFLFAFISILEESGYMARVVVMMDRLVRRFGLSGKSVVPLISSMACAVPAIMSARTIGNWKERLITIMVTPLMSCSARLPIYTILIALVVPEKTALGFFNLQGLTLMGLYLLGFFAAIFSAWLMKKILKTNEKGYFIMELPTYKMPRWKQVAYTIFEKSKTFVFEAGKVIVAISIILWVLSSYGPEDSTEAQRQKGTEEQRYKGIGLEESQELKDASLEESQSASGTPPVYNPQSAISTASTRLENSYAGHFGKWIEPAIKPLGYDWKIGIALLTSFAAREVFVGTISTIYSIGSDAEETTLKARLRAEKDPETGEPRYTPAVAFSLLVFYAFAMMCMSTLAVTYRETKSWKYPLIQLLYMSALAYISAFLVYQGLK